jgi:hypothetical protein
MTSDSSSFLRLIIRLLFRHPRKVVHYPVELFRALNADIELPELFIKIPSLCDVTHPSRPSLAAGMIAGPKFITNLVIPTLCCMYIQDFQLEFSDLLQKFNH